MDVPAKPRIRIFVSSPGDVREERMAAERVLKRLRDQYASEAIIEPYFWEDQPIGATKHFQEGIEMASEFDVVVCILWRKLGTRLPAQFRREDGTEYESGTVYEFEDAFERYRRLGWPELLVYRKTAHPPMTATSPDEAEEFAKQWRNLETFWSTWFHDEEGRSKRAQRRFERVREFEDLLSIHIQNYVERRMQDAGRREAVWKNESPFRGLNVFEPQHWPIFFGREADTHRVVQKLKAQSENGRAFVLITGPSGCGKSSLARAGVLPHLLDSQNNTEFGSWCHAILRPGAPQQPGGDPFDALAEALVGENALPELARYDRLADLMRSAPAQIPVLVQGEVQKAAQAKKENGAAGLLLVVDQLEELFTQDFSEETLQKFSVALASLSKSHGTWIVATLRSDYYARLAAVPELAELKEGSGQHDLIAPTKGEIGQMIRRPAFAAGLQFETRRDTGESLDDRLREDASRNPAGLPLLEFALQQLYEKAKAAHSDLLSFANYEEIGGIEGAIARQANETFAKVSPQARGALPRLFRGLVSVSAEADAPTRRRALRADIASELATNELADAFVESRLLSAGEASGLATLELTHEALLAHWAPLTDWLRAEEALLRARARLESAAARWTAANRAADLLLPSGTPLEEAEQVCAARLLSGPSAREADEFVRFSRSAALRRQRVKLIAAVSLVALALLASLGAIWANQERSRAVDAEGKANTQTQLANTRFERAVKAESEAKKQTELAEKLAAEAEVERNKAVAAADDARTARDEAQKLAASEKTAKEDAQNLVYLSRIRLAEREWLAGNIRQVKEVLESCDPTRRGWEWKYQYGLLNTQRDQLNTDWPATCLSRSRDGRVIAAGTEMGGVAVWIKMKDKNFLRIPSDLRMGEISAPLNKRLLIGSVAVSPNGEYIAAAGRDVLPTNRNARVMVWRVAQPNPVLSISVECQSLAFSADSHTLIVGSSESSLRDKKAKIDFWNIAGSKKLGSIDSEFEIDSIALSVDGKTLAAADVTGKVTLWKVDTREQELTVQASGHATALTFSPDGKLLAVGMLSGLIDLWRLDVLRGSDATQRSVITLTGHAAKVTAIAFDPDGELLASSAFDHMVKVWSVESKQEVRTFRGHEGLVTGVVFTPDGNEILSVGDDSRLKFWNAHEDQDARSYLGHFAAVSPDGKLVATIWRDETDGKKHAVWLWNTESGEKVRVLDPIEEHAYEVAFDLEGQRIAAAHGKGVTVWNVADGKRLIDVDTKRTVVSQIRFSPARDRLIGIVGGSSLDHVPYQLRIWDAETGQTIINVGVGDKQIGSLDVSIDGRLIAVATEQVLVIDARTGQLVKKFIGSLSAGAAFHPDGKHLVIGGGLPGSYGTVAVYDLDTSEKTFELPELAEPVPAVGFTPDGKMLVLGSNDGSVRLIDLKTNQEILRLQHAPEHSLMNHLAFSSDGRVLVTCNGNYFFGGYTRVWRGDEPKQKSP
jgi:WD40 repeat protein/energy-coupling factor transporter ATP-binding protein EcfA2